MLIEINAHGGVPIYRQVLDQIRRAVFSGELAEGDQLPSVRDLAEELKVNPMTISKVYGLLEMEGLAVRRRGVGLFVARVTAAENRRAREEILEEAVRRAASQMIQFGLSEAEAVDLFLKVFRDYDSKKARSG